MVSKDVEDAMMVRMREEFDLLYQTKVATKEELGQVKMDLEMKVENLRKEVVKEFEGVMNLNVNVKELESKSSQVKIQLESLRQNIEKKFEELIEKVSKPKKQKESLTTKRAFSSLPTYSGKHEEFDDWKFKLKAFSEKIKISKK